MTQVDPLFAGVGELAGVMAARDWAATPLGPPQGWSTALRSSVRTVLTSRFSMWMAWGPELTFFYNESYRRDTLRAKHPWAMGRPASEVWSEIWDGIEPRVRAVIDTGAATWDSSLMLFLERSGYPEETYHTFSYSPLGDADGTVQGLLCVVNEDTDRVLAERRMQTLRDVAAAVGNMRSRADLFTATGRELARNGRDLPFALVYLLDDDGTARLAATAGISAGHAAAPAVLPAGDATWPVADVRAGRTVVIQRLGERFADLPSGSWDRPPDEAAVVPFPGQDGSPPGFLVAALNPHRRLGDRYRGFVDLLASQIASAVGNVVAYEVQQRRAEELVELDRAKTAFFSNVSHEFRTPLTLLLGPVAQLRDAPAIAADPRLTDEIDVVARNAQRLSRLVNTLLDFSRLEAGRAQAAYERLDLPATTAELAGMFRAAIERAGLELRVDCPPLAEAIFVDRDMWEKIVFNLLSNAVKFTTDGIIAVRVAAGERDGRPGAELVIADTGIGVPPAEVGRLFERFHQVAGARGRSAEGSGIGLALARQLIELHGGTIAATSELGRGTTFTAWIPAGSAHLPADALRPDAEAADGQTRSDIAETFLAEALRWPIAPEIEPPTVAAVAPVAGDAPGRAVGRVLVAEDNADMREYLVRLLGERHHVQAVSDGRAALAAARADPPDLVVSDVMMPGLDGLGLLAALRGDQETASVPVLLLSARAGEEAAVEGIAGGADDYLVKPFSAAELLARVDGHLRLGRARREAELRFRQLADATPALIWADDAQGRRLLVNRAWREFTGAGATEDLGDGWRARIHPADRARYAEARTGGGPFEVEYRLRHVDGRYLWVLDRGAPVADGGHVGGCLDIDARQRERERRRLLDAVGTAMEAEATLPGRRQVLVTGLVEAGIADLVRLVELRDGHASTVALAAADHARTALMRRITTPTLFDDPGLEQTQPRLYSLDEKYILASSPDPEQQALRRALGMRTMVAVPLRTRGRNVGLLVAARVGDSLPQDETDVALLGEIGERAATALDNAALLAGERLTSRRLELLQRATAALSAAASPRAVAAAAVEQFDQLMGTSAVAVWEPWEGTSLEAITMGTWSSSVRRGWATIPIDTNSPVAATFRDGLPRWLMRDADWEPSWAPRRDLLIGHGYRSVAVLPLVVGEEIVGVLGAAFPDEPTMSGPDRLAVLALADQCAQALQRAGLLATESAARRTAEELSKLVAALSEAPTIAKVVDVIRGHAAALGAEQAVVVLRSGEQLDVVGGIDLPVGSPPEQRPEPDDAGRRLHLSDAHPIALAVRTGRPVWQAERSAAAWPDAALTTGGSPLPADVVVPLLLEGSAIGAVAMSFAGEPTMLAAADRNALSTVAAQCAQALDRARLHQVEHEVADVLQRSLLPREFDRFERLTSAARYVPGSADTQAGGDWYELLPVDENRVALVVGDVVGHGPGAAAVMGQLRSALAAYLLDGHGPAAALERLDRFATRIPGARGSTCVCLTLDRSTGVLCWARAGHLPVLLLHPAGPTYLADGSGTVLGVRGRPPYLEATTRIDPGTSVLLYTDGLVERRGEVVDEGLARLAAVAHRHRGEAPETLAGNIVAEVLDDEGPPDDIALVVVRLMPRPLATSLPARPTALRTLRRAVTAWGEAAGLPAELVEDLQLALGEAAANSVEHAYPEPGPDDTFSYTLSRTADDALAVRVRDHGRWRPAPADPGHRGRGMQVIRALGEDVHVEAGADGTEVHFLLRADAPGRTSPPAPAHPAPVAAAATVVAVAGDLDLTGAAQLRPRLWAALDGGAPVVADLREVDHLTSAGIALLVEALDHAGARLSVRVRPDSAAARVLALTGVDSTLPVTQES